MYTARQLIIDSFKRSTIRGLGDVPDALETADALSMLNDILDLLSRKQGFSEGYSTYIVSKPQGRDYITFSDSKARTFSAVADNDAITCNFGDNHLMGEGERIIARIGGYDIDTTISSVTSPLSFTLPADTRLNGAYVGSFKKYDEGEEYLVDIIATPPVNVEKVVASGRGELRPLLQQDFYRGVRDHGWFYEKTRDPYPKLFVFGSDRVKVIFPKPVLRNVTLDTDFSGMDEAARVAIKYRLAAEIAGANGFDEKMKTLLAMYKNAFATYERSARQAEAPLPDISAPGYIGRCYNIFTDGVVNESF